MIKDSELRCSTPIPLSNQEAPRLQRQRLFTVTISGILSELSRCRGAEQQDDSEPGCKAGEPTLSRERMSTACSGEKLLSTNSRGYGLRLSSPNTIQQK